MQTQHEAGTTLLMNPAINSGLFTIVLRTLPCILIGDFCNDLKRILSVKGNHENDERKI